MSGGVLLVAGVLLLFIGVIATVQAITGDSGDIGGLPFIFIVALLLAQIGRVLLLRPARQRSRQLRTPHGVRASHRGHRGDTPPPETGAIQYGSLGPPGLLPAPPSEAALRSSPARTVDMSVRHRQLFCQFPAVRTAVAAVLTAAGVLAIVLTPNSSGNGPQGFLFLLPVAPGIYLFAVLLYLPYRIRIRDGVLTLGVVGVPRVGRLWRSLEVNLADVQQWSIVAKPRRRPAWARRGAVPAPRAPSQPNSDMPATPNATAHDAQSGPASPPQELDERRTGGANINNLSGPGARYSLVVFVAEGNTYGKDFPEYLMVGYTVQTAASRGYHAGPIVIRTRRHEKLRAALLAALPNPPRTDWSAATS